MSVVSMRAHAVSRAVFRRFPGLAALLAPVERDAALGPFLTVLWRMRRLICFAGWGAVLTTYAVVAAATPSAWLHLWGVLATVFFVIAYRYVSRWIQGSRAVFLILRAVLFVGAVTLAMPLLAFDRMDAVDHAMISMVLVTVSLGLVALTHGYRYLGLWFALPLTLALAAAWWWLPAAGWPYGRFAAESLCVLLIAAFCWGLSRQMDLVFRAGALALQRDRARSEELEQVVKVVEQASRSKTRFLASASHDLRQPLHTIGMLVGVLGKQVTDPAIRPVVEMLQTVNRSLTDQLDSLLDLSRLDAGAITPAVQVLRLDRLVAQHAQQLAPQLAARGLQLVVQCDEAVAVCSDAGLLLRLLGNLTSNALKFTETGRLTLGVGHVGAQAVMWVQDTGPGIAEDMQQQIFEEFVQLGNAQRDVTRGLGLGLAIVDRLCGLLGARVKLVSAAGRGARFEVSLPAHRSGLEPHASPVALPLATTLVAPSLRIVLAGDLSPVLQSTRALLDMAGHKVIVVSDARLALMHVRSGQIDVLLTDFRLPGGHSGIDLIAQTLREAPELRTAVLTSDTLPERIAKLRATGAHVLFKPVVPHELLAWLDLRPDGAASVGPD
jgi:signal transduction histidine kinase/CheY-like chemotaxis protein